jgi:teichoic acid transport system permease protein
LAGTPANEPSPLAALAEQYGLQQQGIRGPFWGYVRKLWRSREFIWTLGLTRTYSRNENTYLGQVWAVINPLIFAGVYYIIFGVVLGTDGGVENFVGFLVIGVFVFQFTSQALLVGANAVVGNTSMIKSLRFPRAALPIASVITELLTLLPAIVVMLVLVGITGEKPTWEWLLVPVMFLVITVFNVGMALFMSRLVYEYRDLRNLISHVVRVLRYVSGVFFLISHYVGDGFFGKVLEYQPYALALDAIRAPLLAEFPLSQGHLIAMTAWAVLAIGAGIVFFWRGEGKYGRD